MGMILVVSLALLYPSYILRTRIYLAGQWVFTQIDQDFSPQSARLWCFVRYVIIDPTFDQLKSIDTCFDCITASQMSGTNERAAQVSDGGGRNCEP